MSLFVKIHYGPCEVFFTVSHRPQKLRGLHDQLLKLGYRVELHRVEYRNYCMIEMCGLEVFRCNISNLMCNTGSALDPVCQRVLAAVEDARAHIHRARNYFWLKSWLQEEMFKRTEYAPKDYWPVDFDLQRYAGVMECAACCGIVTAKADKEA